VAVLHVMWVCVGIWCVVSLSEVAVGWVFDGDVCRSMMWYVVYV